MATNIGPLKEKLDATNQKLDTLINLMRRWIYGDGPLEAPPGLGERQAIEERFDGMSHFIKNRQHMADVPINKGIVKQELIVREDGQEILRTEVAFDRATGKEQEPLPTFWAEVGKTVELEVVYTRDDGTVSNPFTESYEQADNFTGPMVDPADLGSTDQIDEVDADTRPTT